MALSHNHGRGHGNFSLWDPLPAGVPFTVFDPSDFTIFERPSSGGQVVGRTNVDWVETPQSHIFTADMPGIKKEEIKVEVLDGKTLSISGERSKEKRSEKDSWRCVERSHGKFRRQFGLPDDADVEKVAAKVEDGVLTVTIPKAHNEAPKVRSINVA